MTENKGNYKGVMLCNRPSGADTNLIKEKF